VTEASCTFGACDGSGFLVDEESRVATPCRCRPQQVERRRARSLSAVIPRRYRGVSFDRPPVTNMAEPIVRPVRAFARTIDEQLAAGRGLWFYGGNGTGKTTLAMLVSKAAMEADHTVAIYSLPRLLAMLRDTYDDGAEFSLSELIDRLCAVDLLHIDDVGAEQTSAWVLEQLYTIVNTRYEDGRTLVLTTNLDDEELKQQIGERTVSRIYEMCGDPKPMFGDDQRKGAGYALPEPAPTPARGPGRWREDDAFWEHGSAGQAAPAPAYGRPRRDAD
jgi:DNA replication protein DnaC